MSSPIFVMSLTVIIGITFTAIGYMLYNRIETVPDIEAQNTTPYTAPHTVPNTEPNTVPFSYNIPVDSHMRLTKDVAVIVVENPDEKISVGMVPR